MIDGLSAMVKRAVVRLVDDARKVQQLQVSLLAGEVAEDVEHMQPYGVSFRPPTGSEAVALSVNGDSSHVLVLGVQRRDDRPTGETNDGAGGLYCLGEWRVYLDPTDGTLHLGAKAPGDWVALASKTDAEIARIWQVLTTWTVVSQDGGAALQTAAIAAEAAVQSVASSAVKCE